MEIIARTGNIYLTSDRPVTEEDPDPVGRMVNLNKGLSYIVQVQSALKQGYWEEVTSVPAEVTEDIKRYYDEVMYDFTTGTYPKFKEGPTPQTSSYSVYKDDKIVGVVSFGGAPAIEITSRDDALVDILTKTMVNPVEVKDEIGGTIYATIGDFLYEEAVLLVMKNAGYETKKR